MTDDLQAASAGDADGVAGMTVKEATDKRTRFARLYSDGSMGLEPAGTDFLTARERLLSSHDDADAEILEVDITVLRTHGKPKLRVARERQVTCPTCGEHIYIEDDADAQAV